MSAVEDFFASLKEDLLGKRMLPFLAVLGVALIAAVAYAVLGGGSSTAPPRSPRRRARRRIRGDWRRGRKPGAGEPQPADIRDDRRHVQAAPRGRARPVHAAAGRKESSGLEHDVEHHVLVLEPVHRAVGWIDAVGPELRRHNAHDAKETTPAKPKVYVHYHVTAQLGVVPVVAEGAPAQPAQLKTYKDMALDEPLPDKTNPQLVFLGVVLRTGKEALFGLTGAAILHGAAAASRARHSVRRSTCRSGSQRRSKSSKPTAAP